MNAYRNRDLCSMCALYHRCGKNEKIIEVAKYFLSQEEKLGQEELTVFVEGYQSLISQSRKKLVQLLEIQKQEKKRKSSHAYLIDELENPLRKKIIDICNDFDNEINKLIPKSKNFEQMIYFTRLKCDFLRYKCQFTKDEKEKKEAKEIFFDNIQKAEQLAHEFFPKDNLRYLELELTKSVFYYEVLNRKDEAIELGKTILKEAEKKDIVPIKKEEHKEIVNNNIETNETQGNEKEEKKDDKKENVKKDKKEEKKEEVNKVEVKKEEDEKKEEEKKEDDKEEKKDDDKKIKVKKEEDSFTIENRKNVQEILNILRTNIVLWSGKAEEDVKF